MALAVSRLGIAAFPLEPYFFKGPLFPCFFPIFEFFSFHGKGFTKKNRKVFSSANSEMDGAVKMQSVADCEPNNFPDILCQAINAFI